MTKLEKVIDGLECCFVGTYEICRECPYHEFYPNRCNVERDQEALELLKEQKARVLTLEELDIIYNAEKTHVWPFNRPPYLWMTINPDVRLTAGYWICWRDIMYSLKNSNPFYVRENYGKAWTIWTKEPTDEQKKAVKWDD